ncbi:hypothetical protein Q5H93_04855 [Hymenobacter sp. ASUV-10]|uniref:TolC family protein n=1 Tax=Hymenobacter aranciens TaxID=3063996 RepID=A0ABT9B7B1_9BACT|nr:hypothetical protein [Hymenobacter sp. ASUV-10]MDO7874052.1 hypothetical protein [Hymenobacter sp. ASUV-10]
MKLSHVLPALLLALPFATLAQTAPATHQVTEVTETIDPATGKVTKRTTRSYSEPVPAAAAAEAEARGAVMAASDADVSKTLGKKTAVSSLTNTNLVAAYDQLLEQTRNKRSGWQAADWTAAASVMASLNTRYEQLRSVLTLDEKLSIRANQAEFQALRLGQQVTRQITDKL